MLRINTNDWPYVNLTYRLVDDASLWTVIWVLSLFSCHEYDNESNIRQVYGCVEQVYIVVRHEL